jgi:peptide/nickel transport system substrate-binding protein
MAVLRSLSLVAALVVLVPACGKSDGPRKKGIEIKNDKAWAKAPDDPKTAKPGGQLVLPFLSEPDSFNPYLTTTADVDDVMKLVYPNLMVEGPDFSQGPPEFTPYAAASWETSADGKTITFHLQKDMNWGDGVPVTADDVRFSWETAKNADVAWTGNSIKDFIDDVKVIDPKTVAMHYTEVYPYQLMDANDGAIIPKHVFSKIPYKDWKTRGTWTAEAGKGAGPYRVTEYTAQERFVLEANPTYFKKGFPRIPKVTFRIIKSLGAQRDALLSGGLDVNQTLPPIEVKRVSDTGQFRIFNFLSRSYTYVSWNCGKAPFDDPEVRRAMTLGINRKELVESIYYGYAEVGASPIISAFWAHDASIKPWPYDRAEAEKILQARGWKKGSDGIYAKDGKRLSFTISVSASNEIRQKACTKVQAHLKLIGVEVKIELVDFNTLSERTRKHDFEATYGAWGVATKVDMKSTFHSSERGYDGHNFVDYSNPRVDEIIEKARIMSDFPAAKKLWSEFEQILQKEQPYTHVAEPRQLNVYRNKIRGVLSASTSPYHNLEEWWIDETAE